MFLLKVPDNTDPKINLAIEEYAVRNLSSESDYLFVYINGPSVIIGKNQNPFQEVNLSFANKNKIEVLRRISGGGAVYNESGNVNFCYITNNTRENFNNYKNFLQPVISYLHKLNIPAEINDRNDIVVKGKKVSGNAQFTSRNRMFSHGTLLFNANLEKISKVLNPRSVPNIESKSTKSVKSTVTNLQNYLGKQHTIEAFKSGLIESILSSYTNSGTVEFNARQWQDIYSLIKEKYSTREWNFGRTPKFKLKVEITKLGFAAALEINSNIIDKIVPDPGSRFTELKHEMKSVFYSRKEIKTVLDILYSQNPMVNIKDLTNAFYPF